MWDRRQHQRERWVLDGPSLIWMLGWAEQRILGLAFEVPDGLACEEQTEECQEHQENSWQQHPLQESCWGPAQVRSWELAPGRTRLALAKISWTSLIIWSD